MANKILTLGSPGSGKSTALETLNPEEVFIICSDEKGLPFPKWRRNYTTKYSEDGRLSISESNYYQTNDIQHVAMLITSIAEKRPDIKVIVVDTITALMEQEFMGRAKEKGFDKYTDMGLSVFNLVTLPEKLKRDDLTVIFMAHTEDKYDSEGVLKTSFKVIGGKLVGEKIEIEGRFNIVLYAEVVQEGNDFKYYFNTQTNGKNTCRSPRGMFERRIPNDFKYVLERIKDYEG